MTDNEVQPPSPMEVTPVGDGSFSVGPLSAATSEQLQQLPVMLAKVGAEMRAAMEGAGREAGRQLVAMAKSVRASREGPPPPPPLSVKERALLVRQNRHTGPRGNTRRRKGR